MSERTLLVYVIDFTPSIEGMRECRELIERLHAEYLRRREAYRRNLDALVDRFRVELAAEARTAAAIAEADPAGPRRYRIGSLDAGPVPAEADRLAARPGLGRYFRNAVLGSVLAASDLAGDEPEPARYVWPAAPYPPLGYVVEGPNLSAAVLGFEAADPSAIRPVEDLGDEATAWPSNMRVARPPAEVPTDWWGQPVRE